jgi:hypothetical protein
MGRSFSFTTAWSRNARHQTRLERAASDLAREIGEGDQRDVDPYWRGDQLRREVHLDRDATGEVVRNRVGIEDYPGGVDGSHGDLTYKGEPIVVEGREFDRDAGTMALTFHTETEAGRIETRRVEMERTGDGQWAWGPSRVVRE